MGNEGPAGLSLILIYFLSGLASFYKVSAFIECFVIGIKGAWAWPPGEGLEFLRALVYSILSLPGPLFTFSLAQVSLRFSGLGFPLTRAHPKVKGI